MTPSFLQFSHLLRSMLSFSPLTMMSIVSVATFASTMSASGQPVHQDNPIIKWHTGDALNQFNQLAISAWWSDAELRERIMRFSKTQQLAIFLDRRVDPATKIELSVQDVTKEQFLWTVAEKNKLGVCRIEDFYYIGPIETAACLPEVCQQLILTTAQRRAAKVDWHDKQNLKTDSVVRPKQFLLDLARENHFRIDNLDSIPHDIWAGFELPKTSLQVRVAILLVGFGKTFERNKDGTVITVVDFPNPQTTEVQFRDLENPQELARLLKPKFPDAKFAVKGNRIVVTGPPLQIAAVQSQIVAAQTPTGVNNAEKTFTLTTRAARGSLLATAAKLTNTSLVFDKSDRDIAQTLLEPIEVRAVNASLGELLQIALEGTNLKCELVEDELIVTER